MYWYLVAFLYEIDNLRDVRLKTTVKLVYSYQEQAVL